jgi:hypothetical protein
LKVSGTNDFPTNYRFGELIFIDTGAGVLYSSPIVNCATMLSVRYVFR